MIGDLAHVCNRGVEKRKIFLNTHDYQRFVDNLYLLNNQSGKIRTERKQVFQSDNPLPKQDKLVEILKWSLLPNHYHLLLYEVTEGGILEFTKRLGNAYTKYFNNKNEGRSGYLFQNSAKIISVVEDTHFLYLPFYIDLNALDLLYPDWENNQIKDNKKALDFLKSYTWSSLRDYYSEGSFYPVIDTRLFYELFDMNSEKYERELEFFLKEPFKQDPSTWQVDGLELGNRK